jgi:FMN reductase
MDWVEPSSTSCKQGVWMALSVTGISGSVRRPSRTCTLVRTLLGAVDRRLDPDGRLRRPSHGPSTIGAYSAGGGTPEQDTDAGRREARLTLVDMADAAPLIFSSLTRAQTSPAGEAVVRSVETADALIVATPVYRACYTGALKHLFDLVSHEALAGKPVILAATGGSHMHGLVTEHQLRPLLGFFGALTVPTTIYAAEADFDEFTLINAAVFERIDRAADDLARLIAAPPASARQSATARQLVAASL